MKCNVFLRLLISFALFPTLLQAQVYVDKANPGPTHDGLTWATAYLTISEAIDDPRSAMQSIWVAEGEYTENLTLTDGRKLYGSFTAGDTSLADRDLVELTSTIFASGDEPRRPLTAIGVTNTTVNGFIITNGRGGGSDLETQGGAVLFFMADDSNRLELCDIVENSTIGDGGAVAIMNNSSPHITNCEFIGNLADDDGGAIYVTDFSNPTIGACYFQFNNAGDRGGNIYVSNNSAPTIAHCVISDGTANEGGGAFFRDNSNAMVNDTEFKFNIARLHGAGVGVTENSTPTFTQCEFRNNDVVPVPKSSAAQEDAKLAGFLGLPGLFGGGAYVDASNPTFNDCEFLDNRANYGAGIGVWNASPVVNNSAFESNAAMSLGGGGFIAGQSGQAQFNDCDFVSNSTGTDAAAIFTDGDVSPVFSRCDIMFHNDSGAARYLFQSNTGATPVFRDCRILNNSNRGFRIVGDSSPVIERCLFANNQAGAIVAEGNAASTPTVTNSVFYDNDNTDVSGIISIGNAFLDIVNCTIDRSSSSNNPSAVFVSGQSRPRLTNTVISNTLGNAVYLESAGARIELDSCQIWNTTALDYVNNAENLFLFTAQQINNLAPDARDNFNGSPRYIMDEPSGFHGAFESHESVDLGSGIFTTVFTDNEANFPPGGLVNEIIEIDDTDGILHVIIANSSKAITVADSYTNTALPAAYKVLDFSLALQSAGVDRGRSAGAPDNDFKQLPRPVDTAGLGLPGRSVDVGAHELQTTSVPGGVPDVVYVDWEARGLGNGTSWIDAYNSLHDAVADPASATKEIWIANGIYGPFIQIPSGRRIIGGFRTGDVSKADRDLLDSKAILQPNYVIIMLGKSLESDEPSIELLPPDSMTSPVVALINTTGVILDGLIIADGQNQRDFGPARVGGLYMEDCDESNIIRNCEIRNNQALDGNAHGVLLESSSPRFERTIIENNRHSQTSISYAGGLNALRGSSPTFVDCDIRQNVGEAVGGMIFDMDCHPVLTNTRIHTNAATNGSGSTYGGMWVVNSSTAMLTDCLIGDNSAQGVGGYGQSGGSVQMTRCVITGNLGNATGGMKLSSGNELGSMIRDSIISGNISNLIGGMRLTDDSTLINCVVGGNFGTNGIIETSDSGDQVFQNCTISRNRVFQQGEGVFRAGAGSNLRLVNCIVEGNIGDGVQELSPGVAVDLINNLFHDNDQDYKDLVGPDTFYYQGAMELNTMIDGGTQMGNVAGPARFVMDETPLEGTLTAATVEVNEFASRLTDDNANFIPGELKGKHLNIPQDEDRHLYILDNTATTIDYLKVGGVGPSLAGMPHVNSIPAIGQRYFVVDYSPTKYSAAVDRGTTAGAPDADIAGMPRPVDSIGLGVDGPGAFDIGAHEFQQTNVSAPVDVVYVDSEATGANDGTSWVDAHNTIQAAIDNPESATKQIWVAEGFYTEKITLASNRKIYANFHPGDLSFEDRDARHPYRKFYDDPYYQPFEGEVAEDASEAPFPSEGVTVILSSEALGLGSLITLNGVTDVLMDGFIVSGGNAFATVGPDSRGGGISCTNVNNTNVFRNLFMVGNRAFTTGGAMYLVQSSSPRIESIVFQENSAVTGAAIYAETTCSPEILSSYFKDNTGTIGAGLACIDNCSPSLTNTTFFRNMATDQGGGIYADSGSSLAITTCFFDANNESVSGDTGGAIYGNGISLTLNNSRFFRNDSDAGGAIYLSNGSTGSAADCLFLRNESSSGYGACVISESHFDFLRTVFLENSAANYGGGVYMTGSTGSFDQCRFADNSSGNYGGGVGLINCADISILNTLFHFNVSSLGGGAIYMEDMTAEIRHCTFSKNGGSGTAGGIYLEGTASPLITSSIFANNVNRAIWENTADSDPVATFNLFHSNTSSDYYDEGTTNYTGAADINANVAEASDNVDGDPLFRMDGPFAQTGDWTEEKEVGEVPYFTLFTDANANYTTGSLVGRLLQPNTNAENVYYIFANTSTLIAVFGNAQDSINFGYRILDYQLGAGSAALDLATATGAPAVDLRNNSRPVDIDNVGFDGAGEGYDIGAFEWQPPVASVPFATLNVGEQFIGGRTDLMVPITNTGGDPLEFDGFGMSFIGANADDFFFDPSPPDMTMIMPGEMREIPFAFSPESVGPRSAILNIQTSDPNSPQTAIILNGVGLERLDSWVIH